MRNLMLQLFTTECKTHQKCSPKGIGNQWHADNTTSKPIHLLAFLYLLVHHQLNDPFLTENQKMYREVNEDHYSDSDLCIWHCYWKASCVKVNLIFNSTSIVWLTFIVWQEECQGVCRASAARWSGHLLCAPVVTSKIARKLVICKLFWPLLHQVCWSSRLNYWTTCDGDTIVTISNHNVE